MKGLRHPRNDRTLNPSGNPSIHDVIDAVDAGRRRFVQGATASASLAAAGGLTLSGLVQTVQAAPVPPGQGFPGIGFESIPPALAPLPDAVRVPAGYTVEAFVAWGDPIAAGGVAFAPDASNTATEQTRQFGAHCDGMYLFPFTGAGGQATPDRGVLAVNNEYTHEEILFPDGQVGASGYGIAKTRKSQAAHGVSLVEARRLNGRWTAVKNSPYGRRITANTPMRVSGPAAGHALMKTVEYAITDAGSSATGLTTDGRVAQGTINNCGNGITPWGTFLTCEENWNGNFGSNAALPSATSGDTGKLYNRYGVTASGNGYRWHTTDPRFDLSVNPNETNLFGWIVEIDPYDPKSKPVKRTALGRFKHESAQYVVDAANRLGVYMGDDERNEYIYKFVAAGAFDPLNRGANRDLLDTGVLYVARFDADLTGRWIPLLPETVGTDGVVGAEVLAKILIKARMAGDAVGATMMDRPEWTGARPRIGGYQQVELYCTLTNNNRRGSTPVTPATPAANAADGSTTAGSARPGVDAANPRANNLYGHVIRWRENGASVLATTFTWDIFVQAGDSATTKTPKSQYEGNIADTPAGSADFGAPDGLWFDPFGRLWVQTDQAGNALGDWVNIGANCMVCADPHTGEARRFLTAPPNAEVTGIAMSADGRALFVGIQHPGEEAPASNPQQTSSWPASQWPLRADGVTPLPFGRPRSSVVVITKNDGGIIGT